eukprot:TRINITY_DN61802_c0_g1_i1.p1 TRINITY_DN61802_c0_g1~~TRINITY_DN61802_c0_g1_i1.p1  ORF type:complete len:508 (+),score=71.08 TRINITY_DN61802_c0_g1_i1:78-1601(+)
MDRSARLAAAGASTVAFAPRHSRHRSLDSSASVGSVLLSTNKPTVRGNTPPAFLARPPRLPARACKQGLGTDIAGSEVLTSSLAPPRQLPKLDAPPPELELPPQALAQPQRFRRAATPTVGGLSSTAGRSSVARRRAISLPPLPEEHSLDLQKSWTASEKEPSLPPPLVPNVPSFERPQAYLDSLRDIDPPAPSRRIRGSSSSSTAGSSSFSVPSRRGGLHVSPIDAAIKRELMGDGIALEEVVESRREAGWAVKQRHVQRSDLGHCCHGCHQPLRDLSEEVTVWTGAAIYRRFHPACAASFVLRADGGLPQGGRRREDVVEGYADGWRSLSDDGGHQQNPSTAARQWLLSQDPTAWPSLRGDVFATVTVIENGKKKAVPGLSHDQLRTLQKKHLWLPESRESEPIGREGTDEGVELPTDVCSADVADEAGLDEESCNPDCAICFATIEAKGPPCVQLPCAPQHVFHASCVLPWLKKASLCPTCRKDLRPLLSEKAEALQPSGDAEL